MSTLAVRCEVCDEDLVASGLVHHMEEHGKPDLTEENFAWLSSQKYFIVMLVLQAKLANLEHEKSETEARFSIMEAQVAALISKHEKDIEALVAQHEIALAELKTRLLNLEAKKADGQLPGNTVAQRSSPLGEAFLATFFQTRVLFRVWTWLKAFWGYLSGEELATTAATARKNYAVQKVTRDEQDQGAVTGRSEQLPCPRSGEEKHPDQ